MLTPDKLNDLRDHLQTAVEVELSTIPLYLYTYYSINRTPTLTIKDENRANEINTFANKAGGILMSVAVEEMLHLSLASNILKALGGSPVIYDKSPKNYPTNLLHHKDGFSIGLTKLTQSQLQKFMDVEKPAPVEEDPQGDQWETLGQFYEYIANLVKQTEEWDYSNPDNQLVDGRGYYAPNNIDTVYAKDAAQSSSTVQYANSDDSGGLKQIKNKEDALAAITEISEQGEGFRTDPTHKYDDPSHEEESHWFKYSELNTKFFELELTDEEKKQFIFNFPENPGNPENPNNVELPIKYQPVVDLCDAVYSYLLWMTEMSFTLKGTAQSSMFYIGMHKGMIFILDKIIGGMRRATYKDEKGNEWNLAPTFKNFTFSSKETAKKELVALAELVILENKLKLETEYELSEDILQRIKDLPDVNVVGNKVSFA